MIKINHGVNIPVSGAPKQSITSTIKPSTIAIIGTDYQGLKPKMQVKIGDAVLSGQTLFTLKSNELVRYTSPLSGKVKEINRGNKRILESVVIEQLGDESVKFEHYKGADISTQTAEEIKNLLLESGCWSYFRTRPFSQTPNPEKTPQAIFITCSDTNPLSANPEVVINEYKQHFLNGLKVISQLFSGDKYLCYSANSNIAQYKNEAKEIIFNAFSGPHPAGLVGTHIHALHPVNSEREVWHIGYQDIISVGGLFTNGKLFNERVISVAGSQVLNPSLIKTVRGASIADITDGRLRNNSNRIISGSLLNGRTAHRQFAYLGQFHNQISIIEEGKKRELLSWLGPGKNKFSITRSFIGKYISKSFPFNTFCQGSPRAMVPIGLFEKVLGFDTAPTYLLRALITNDAEESAKLGLLEMDEEDLALCTFVCPSKIDYGKKLRENLITIEKEG